jgi:acetoin utilization protein AcuC
MAASTLLYTGTLLANYGFPDGHPLGVDRQGAFLAAAEGRGLLERAGLGEPRIATRAELARFHTERYISWVEQRSELGEGYLDDGDTPAFPGVFERAAAVAGSALDGLERLMAGEARRAFQPIGGLHHARRDRAAGFCVFNDLGVVIETLRSRFGVRRIGYVDIDVHHGDGIYYSYEVDRDLIFVDVHEDGRFLYPGTGHADEVGRGHAAGSKLNFPLPPGSGDREFWGVWKQGLQHLRRHRPEFLILQCGADGMAGDPLADLRYTSAVHARVARDLRELAEELCGGRLMAFGGGGYNLRNLAGAWTTVLEALL